MKESSLTDSPVVVQSARRLIEYTPSEVQFGFPKVPL